MVNLAPFASQISMSPFVIKRLLALAVVRVKSVVTTTAIVRMVVTAVTGVIWRVVVCAIDANIVFRRFCFCGS